MDFTPTPEQQMMVDACRRLVQGELDPLLAAHPADKPLPKAATQTVLRHLATLGLTAARVPIEAGGTGMGALDYGLICEQLPPEILFILLPQETTITRINYSCTEAQRRTLLPRLIAADLITCTAATEPDVGSDPRGIRTRLRRDGDHYVLNGRKLWISNATVSDIVNVTCVDEDGKMVRVLVDREQSPFDASEVPVTGLQRCHLGELAFHDCRIPAENRLGDSDDAARILTLTWLANRPIIGLAAVHLAQKAFDSARQFAADRRQFGRTIHEFQLIQERLADIETEIVTARLLCYYALAALDRGERANGPSAMAKRYAVAAGERAIALAMRVHGAMGLSQEMKIERMARDVRMFSIPDGTPEILTLIQGREITGFAAFRG